MKQIGKKAVSLALAGTMVASVMVPVAASNSRFVDMPNNYATGALQAAVDNGLLSGYDNQISPMGNLTRAEMAAILVRAFGSNGSVDLSGYYDVKPGAWYVPELSKAVKMGAFQGFGWYMNPEDSITRQEAFTVLSRVFDLPAGNTSYLRNFADYSQIDSWAMDGIAAMVSAGYVQGTGNKIEPDAYITRQDFAVTMDRLVKNYITRPGTYSKVSTGSVMVNAGNVTLKNMTIHGDLIIGDGVGSGDITLDNVDVTGDVLVRGGGLHTVDIKGGSSVDVVRVAKVDGNVRIYVNGATVGTVEINDGKDAVVVEGKVGKLVVGEDNMTVYATNADIASVNVYGDDTTLILEKTTEVKHVYVWETAADAMVILRDKHTQVGSVKTMARNTGVQAGKDTKVDTVVVENTYAGISGDGEVSEVLVYDDNATIKTANTKVVVAKYVKGTMADGKPVAGGKTVITGEEADYFKVTFDDLLEETPDKVKAVEAGGYVLSIPQPERKGYDFEGWYTLKGVKFTEKTEVTESMTVYAKWSKSTLGKKSIEVETVKAFTKALANSEIKNIYVQNSKITTLPEDCTISNDKKIIWADGTVTRVKATKS